MGTKVSVILPVYNVSDYLRQCMDSIVGQTLKDIEIICVDDGSTDDSLAILKEYEAKDQRVKVIQQANAGAGAARNKGLEIATGEYLSFLDSDDFFEPDMVAMSSTGSRALFSRIFKSCSIVIYSLSTLYTEIRRKLCISIAQAPADCT